MPHADSKIHEKKATPPITTQNVQMMRSEPCNDELMVNMVLWHDATIGEVNGETNMEARESFMGVSTQGSRDRAKLARDPSMLTTFLKTCIKLLRDNRVVKGLHEVTNRCVGWGEPRTVRKLGRHASRTGREMWLTLQIGDYKMD